MVSKVYLFVYSLTKPLYNGCVPSKQGSERAKCSHGSRKQVQHRREGMMVIHLVWKGTSLAWSRRNKERGLHKPLKFGTHRLALEY